MKWHDDQEELLRFCEWLDSECVMFHSTRNALDMLKKPLRWQREYDAWRLWLEVPPECKRTKQMVVEAVIAGDAIDWHFCQRVRDSYKREQCGSKHHSFPTRIFNLLFGVTEPEEDNHE